MATFRRRDPQMRGWRTPDKDTSFARHMLLNGMFSGTTYSCDPYTSWQKCGVENASGGIRRWPLRGTDLDEIGDADIREILITIDLTPRKNSAFGSQSRPFSRHLGATVRSAFLDALQSALEPAEAAGRADKIAA